MPLYCTQNRIEPTKAIGQIGTKRMRRAWSMSQSSIYISSSLHWVQEQEMTSCTAIKDMLQQDTDSAVENCQAEKRDKNMVDAIV